MKKALVLSGGGSLGAFQVGVLKRLLEADPNLEYDIHTGISVGALNSSLLATGPIRETLPLLEDVWLRNIKGNSTIWNHKLLKVLAALVMSSLVACSISFLFFIFQLPMWTILASGGVAFVLAALAVGFVVLPIFPNNKSVYDNTPLRKLVNKRLDLNKLKSSGKMLRVGAVCYETGEYKTATESSENIVDWIMASSSLPVFFPMVKIEDKHWVDGGIIETAPLKDAIELGATDIDVIVTTPMIVSRKKDTRLLSQIGRVIDIMAREIMVNDIKYNSKKVKIRVIAPKSNFDFDVLDFSPKKIRKMYSSDYEFSWVKQ